MRSHLHAVPGGARFRDIRNRGEPQGWGLGWGLSECGGQFSFGKVRKFWRWWGEVVSQQGEC